MVMAARIIRDTLALAVIVACEWLMIVLLAASNG